MKAMHQKHLYVMGILTLIFIALLLISGSQLGLSVSVDFKEEVNDVAKKDADISVGTVSVSNEWFFPKRVILSSYVACDFSTVRAEEYMVDYYGSDAKDHVEGYDDEYTDLGPGEEQQLDLRIRHYRLLDIFNETQRNTTTLHIYAVNGRDERYGTCSDREPEEADYEVLLRHDNE